MPTPFHTCARAPCPCPRLPCIPLPPPSSLHPLAPAFPASPAFHFSEPHKARIALTPPHSAYCTHSLSHPCSSPDGMCARTRVEGAGRTGMHRSASYLHLAGREHDHEHDPSERQDDHPRGLVHMWGLEIVESLKSRSAIRWRSPFATSWPPRHEHIKHTSSRQVYRCHSRLTRALCGYHGKAIRTRLEFPNREIPSSLSDSTCTHVGTLILMCHRLRSIFV